MKKCLKSQPEPVCLSRFREDNPNCRWQQFRDQNPDCYMELRNATRRDQGGLCAYCEIKLDTTNEQIAHFHPKSDTSYPWTFDWGNLWLACKGGSQTMLGNPQDYLPPLPDNLSCDEYKGSDIVDDMVLTPGEIPAFPRIFRFEQFPDRIEIRVDEDACNSAGIEIDKVQRTIDVFNLNCTRLATARLLLFSQIENAIKSLRNSHVDPGAGLASLARKHLAKDSSGDWQQFFTLVRWRFCEIAEEYLHSIGYTG